MTKHQEPIESVVYQSINCGEQGFIITEYKDQYPNEHVELIEVRDGIFPTGKTMLSIIDKVIVGHKALKEGYCILSLRSAQYEIHVN